jgi:hypothetical protein
VYVHDSPAAGFEASLSSPRRREKKKEPEVTKHEFDELRKRLDDQNR